MRTILPDNAAEETTLRNLLPGSIGPHPSDESFSVVIATDQDPIPVAESSGFTAFIARQVTVSATVPLIASALGTNYPGRKLLSITNVGTNPIYLGESTVASDGLRVAEILNVDERVSIPASDAMNLYMIAGPTNAGLVQVAEYK